MTYTLGDAAKATGKSKPTISRAIKNGTISAKKNENGSYSIDPSELHRVYPPLPRNSNEDGTPSPSTPPNNNSVLQRENEILREQLDDLKSERDEWREQAKRQTILLENQVENTEKKPARGFFRLFKGN
ncbi:hypothetical protein [uncultured Kiloniella sp.]|uniref:hypothetical protein n=1 Tax=uncultured Kiloniella sp. TaxID=1133091 RepID=UPI00260850CC|nr:hypothetical protein [uncultured Kiloniella sp.]